MLHAKNHKFDSKIFWKFITTICLIAVVLALSINVEHASATPQLPNPPNNNGTPIWNQVELVIVTTADLLPEFSRLADWRSTQGTSATVVTVDWILDVAPHGNDLQETIRNFLILAHDQWQTGYVLLGGNWELLPPRYIRSYLHPYPDTEYLDLASDLYFGCLDGNWDADDDGIYGEMSEDGDNPDLLPELGVGRAPIETPEEASVFVDKIMAHDQTEDLDYLNRALFLAEVLTPWDWQPGDIAYFDGGQVLDNLLPILDASQPPLQATRLYENFTAFEGAGPLTHQTAVDALASGNFNLVFHMGQGSFDALSLGGYPVNELLSLSDVPALNNAPNYFTIMSMTGMTAYNSYPTLFGEMIRSPIGGAVAAFGKTEVTYISASIPHGEAIIQHLLASGFPRLGQAHKLALADLAPMAATNPAYHLTVMESVLLGDPTMCFRHDPVSSVPGTENFSYRNFSLGPCNPNPFNPSTTISFFIPETRHVEMSVFDIRGRLVDQLVYQTMVAGEHSVQWHGTDSRGNNVPSGVYFYSLKADDYSEAKRMVLVR